MVNDDIDAASILYAAHGLFALIFTATIARRCNQRFHSARGSIGIEAGLLVASALISTFGFLSIFLADAFLMRGILSALGLLCLQGCLAVELHLEAWGQCLLSGVLLIAGTGLQIVYLARPDGALLYASLALKILVALDSTITSFRLFMSARRAARQDTQKALPKEEGEEATAPIARSLEAPLQTKGIAFATSAAIAVFGALVLALVFFECCFEANEDDSHLAPAGVHLQHKPAIAIACLILTATTFISLGGHSSRRKATQKRNSMQVSQHEVAEQNDDYTSIPVAWISSSVPSSPNSLTMPQRNPRSGLRRCNSVVTLTLQQSDDPFARAETPVRVVDERERAQRERQSVIRALSPHSDDQSVASQEMSSGLLGGPQPPDISALRVAKSRFRSGSISVLTQMRSLGHSTLTSFDRSSRNRAVTEPSQSLTAVNGSGTTQQSTGSRPRSLSLGALGTTFELAPFDLEQTYSRIEDKEKQIAMGQATRDDLSAICKLKRTFLPTRQHR